MAWSALRSSSPAVVASRGKMVMPMLAGNVGQFVAHHERPRQVVAQFLRDVGDRDDVVQLGQRDGEFVAAEPRHGVGVAHVALQAPADRLQQQVARFMAARVVDFLEVVEVDEQQCQRQAAALRFLDVELEPVLEHVAVRQPGQAVDVDFAQRLLDRLAVVHLAAERMGLLLQAGDGALQRRALGAGVVAFCRQHLGMQRAYFVEGVGVFGRRERRQRIGAQQGEREVRQQGVEIALDMDRGIVLDRRATARRASGPAAARPFRRRRTGGPGGLRWRRG